MAMLCWAVARASSVRAVGLCHSVQHTAGELAADLGLAPEEVDYHVAGINHLAFFLRLERDGEDLYPALREVTPPAANRVRYEVLRHLGYFVTESSEHFAEYVPWFIKARAARPRRALQHPARRVPAPLRGADRRVGDAARAASRRRRRAVPTAPSVEYGADIIRACETGEPFAFNGNVPNAFDGGRLIDALPEDCCVEVPCVASERGIEPQRVGALPRQLAALMQTNVNVQGLTVDAALTGDRDAARHAAMLDPHTGGELALDEIAALVDAMIEAHGDLIPALR